MKINIDFNTDNYYEERKIDKRTHLYKHLVYLGLFSKLGHVADWFPFGRLLWYTNIKQQKFLLESYLENQN